MMKRLAATLTTLLTFAACGSDPAPSGSTTAPGESQELWVAGTPTSPTRPTAPG
ncbi:MAG: hypothetical protein AB8I08_13330 [Sandaracinaceae bacterium]